MPTAPRMNKPRGGYDFWADTLQPGLFGLYDRWTEQKPWPTPAQIDAAVQNPQQLNRGLLNEYLENAVDMAVPFAKVGGLLAHGAMPPGGLFGITSKLPMDEASRAGRMAEMGHESGFWRGGKKAADGPWYARTKEGAAGFDRGDLREYSLKMDNAFSYGKTYTPEDLKEIKSALETRGYDQTAKYLLDIPGDYGGAAPGEAIVQAVKMATGPQAMGPIFKEAGFDVIDMGTELVVTHGQGTVRDAVRAAYDKAKQASPDIFAGLLAPAVGLGAYGFLGPNDDSL